VVVSIPRPEYSPTGVTVHPVGEILTPPPFRTAQGTTNSTLKDRHHPPIQKEKT